MWTRLGSGAESANQIGSGALSDDLRLELGDFGFPTGVHADPLGDVRLSGAACVDDIAGKSLEKVFQGPLPPFEFYSWPPQPEPSTKGCAVALDTVRDLSNNLQADGTFTWDVPAGDWIVRRAGMVPTGSKNSPAAPEATGLEVDKKNRPALKHHFDAYIGKLLARLTPAERKSWKHVVADSYETGPQNWSDGFAATFGKRYGYDPTQFLPALTDRLVGSADQSNRHNTWSGMSRSWIDYLRRCTFLFATRPACGRRRLFHR